MCGLSIHTFHKKLRSFSVTHMRRHHASTWIIMGMFTFPQILFSFESRSLQKANRDRSYYSHTKAIAKMFKNVWQVSSFMPICSFFKHISHPTHTLLICCTDSHPLSRKHSFSPVKTHTHTKTDNNLDDRCSTFKGSAC